MASPKILELSPLHAFLGIQSPEPPAGLRILSWNSCTKTCFQSSKASRIGENIWRDVTHVEVITEDLWRDESEQWWPVVTINLYIHDMRCGSTSTWSGIRGESTRFWDSTCDMQFLPQTLLVYTYVCTCMPHCVLIISVIHSEFQIYIYSILMILHKHVWLLCRNVYPTAFKDTFPALSRAGEHGGNCGLAWMIKDDLPTWICLEQMELLVPTQMYDAFILTCIIFYRNNVSMGWDGAKNKHRSSGWLLDWDFELGNWQEAPW